MLGLFSSFLFLLVDCNLSCLVRNVKFCGGLHFVLVSEVLWKPVWYKKYALLTFVDLIEFIAQVILYACLHRIFFSYFMLTVMITLRKSDVAC